MICIYATDGIFIDIIRNDYNYTDYFVYISFVVNTGLWGYTSVKLEDLDKKFITNKYPDIKQKLLD